MDITQKNILGDNTLNINNDLPDRTLDKEAKRVILDVLNEKNTKWVEILYNSGDGESNRYADQIREFVEQNGFDVKSLRSLSGIKTNDGKTLNGQGIQRSSNDDEIVQFYIGYRVKSSS